MQQIKRYEGKCKSCGWVFGENKIAKIDNMPASCEKCKGDMSVQPIFEEDGKGRNYEVKIFCRETGVELIDGASIPADDFVKFDKKGLERVVVTKLSEAFANMLTDDKKITRLIGR